ncbi:hypothetical protein C0R04_29150 [Streptomyces albidoflavus]|nr:hypothetical protein C0R04_29150 [Streptomyces albidoflavus]RZE87924.1 hypothetical protein C0R03_29160 [Streptomyces albidoflavus]
MNRAVPQVPASSTRPRTASRSRSAALGSAPSVRRGAAVSARFREPAASIRSMSSRLLSHCRRNSSPAGVLIRRPVTSPASVRSRRRASVSTSPSAARSRACWRAVRVPSGRGRAQGTSRKTHIMRAWAGSPGVRGAWRSIRRSRPSAAARSAGSSRPPWYRRWQRVPRRRARWTPTSAASSPALVNSSSAAVSRRTRASSRASSHQSSPAISRIAAWTASEPRSRGPSVIVCTSSAPLPALP